MLMADVPAWLSAHTLHLCGHCSSSCPPAKAVLAQFTALAPSGCPCKVFCRTALKYKQHCPCQEQHNGHTQTLANVQQLPSCWVCWRLFHHPSIFLRGHPGPEKPSKHLRKRERRGRNEEREKGKPFTGHWIRAVTWPWLRLATDSINYKQLPFSSSCQK